MQIYSDPEREKDEHALPDVEVFQLTAIEAAEMDEEMVYEYLKRPEWKYRLATMNRKDRESMLAVMVEEQGIQGGWFWQACMPGCLPDGNAVGPFKTKDEAIADCREGAL